jgi:hypothetical protein
MIYERAMKLVAALRSGNYTQTTGSLTNRVRDAYCCLGVACEISGVAQWYQNEYLGEETMLPREVREYFDFKTAVGRLHTDATRTSIVTDKAGRRTTLTKMNDSGKSFAEIADFIEQNWERL